MYHDIQLEIFDLFIYKLSYHLHDKACIYQYYLFNIPVSDPAFISNTLYVETMLTNLSTRFFTGMAYLLNPPVNSLQSVELLIRFPNYDKS